MDVEKFLVNLGWKKGQGLRPGAIKTALLVKHRKDNKGLGFNPQASEGWWERMFDGHLKSLDVSKAKVGKFAFDEDKRRRETSPLYASFRSGGLLAGTVEPPKPNKKKQPGKHKSKTSQPKSSRSTKKRRSSREDETEPTVKRARHKSHAGD